MYIQMGLSMYIYMYIYIHTHTYIHIYIYTYIYIYILEVMFTTAARLFEGGAQEAVSSMDKNSFRIRAWSWEHQKPRSESGGNGSCVGRV